MGSENEKDTLQPPPGVRNVYEAPTLNVDPSSEQLRALLEEARRADARPIPHVTPIDLPQPARKNADLPPTKTHRGRAWWLLIALLVIAVASFFAGIKLGIIPRSALGPLPEWMPRWLPVP